MAEASSASLEDRIQTVLDDYRPTLYIDGGASINKYPPLFDFFGVNG